MTGPRILIAHWEGLDLFSAGDLEKISSAGHLLDPTPVGDWSDERAVELLGEAEVVLGHWGCPKIDAAMLDRAPKLGLVTYAAGTVKDVVTDAVFERGIRVTSGANANAEPVAEFTLAAILFANKDVVWQRDLMADPGIASRRGPRRSPIGNWDKTIGIVGASMVGRRVIELLQPFPTLRVKLFDPFVDHAEAEAMGVEKVELDHLCATSDIVSIHAPLLPETIGLIGAEHLAAMSDGAVLINTARGPIVDHTPLTTELLSGRISAWLDVTDPEPLPDDSPLRTLPNVFLTPHLAGTQGSELRRMTDYAVEEILRWAAGEPALNEVTASQLPRLA